MVDGRGYAFVNSPNFDFAAGPPEGDVQPGVVGVVTPGREVRVVADDLAFPNGMAVSADGGTLVVADSYRHHLVGFAIADDGSLAERRVWADLGDHNPDGICLDADGAAWYADVPHQVCVRVAEGGEVLDTVDLDRGGFACMLGGAAVPALYVVAAVWPGAAGLMTHTEWDGQVLRKRGRRPRRRLAGALSTSRMVRRWGARTVSLVATAFGLYIVAPGLLALFGSFPRLRDVEPWWFVVLIVLVGGSMASMWWLTRLALRRTGTDRTGPRRRSPGAPQRPRTWPGTPPARSSPAARPRRASSRPRSSSTPASRRQRSPRR